MLIYKYNNKAFVHETTQGFDIPSTVVSKHKVTSKSLYGGSCLKKMVGNRICVASRKRAFKTILSEKLYEIIFVNYVRFKNIIPYITKDCKIFFFAFDENSKYFFRK